MPNNPPSTFIPHDASTGSIAHPRRPSGSGLGDLGLLLAILAFAATAALGVGVFLYNQYLTTTADSKLKKLQVAEQQFQPELVTALQKLDERLQSGQVILSQHNAPSAFFSILNAVTAKTVSFSSLNLNISDRITIDMDGVARSVNSIAFQADQLSKAKSAQGQIFLNPIFSSLSRQKDGVHFHLMTLVDPSAVNFEQLTGGGPSVQQPTVDSGSSAPSTPFGSGSPTTQ